MRLFEGYVKGINLGGWLSQCNHTKERYDNFIVEKDFERIKERGYDHVRVPVDYELIMDGDYNFKESGFSYIEFAIKMCRKYGLNMVLDLHRTPGYSFDTYHNEKGLFDNEKLQDIFYSIWEEFAKRFGENSDMLSFELLNEVTNKEFMETWIKMSKKCYDIIRKYAKDVYILIGGYYNNSVEAVKDLPLPYDDRIVYNFHFYEPIVFTHQGAPWIPTMNTEFRCDFYMTYKEYDRVSKENFEAYSSFKAFDPEKTIGADYFATKINEAIKVADERNVPLYCGEYGVIDRAKKDEAAKWFKLFDSFMDENKISRAVWTYKEMDFEV